MLFALWFDQPHRPTRDADFLGIGELDRDALVTLIRSVSAIEDDDGMTFDPASVVVEEIREETRYGGLRSSAIAWLAQSRRHFGDEVPRCPATFRWD